MPLPKKGEAVLEGPSKFVTKRIVARQEKWPGFTPEQERIEGLVAKSMDRADRAMLGLQEPVKRLIREANSLEEIRDGIYALYSDMDQRDIQELMARAMYVAELYGRSVIATKTLRHQE